MGLLFYLKKQFTLFHFYCKYIRVNLLKGLKNIISKTPGSLTNYLLVLIYQTHSLLLFHLVNFLKKIQIFAPAIFYIVGFIFRIYEYSFVEWYPCFGVFQSFIYLLFLILHHFLAVYEFIFILRIVLEWFPVINPTDNPITEAIVFYTNPFFKVFDNLAPGGRTSILAFFALDLVVKFITSLSSRRMISLASYCLSSNEIYKLQNRTLFKNEFQRLLKI